MTPITVFKGSGSAAPLGRGACRAISRAAISSGSGWLRSDAAVIHGNPASGSTAEPEELRTTSAPTQISPTLALAEPIPPWRPPLIAPVPAPIDPRHGVSARAECTAVRPSAAVGQAVKSPPLPRSKMTAAGTTGTTSVGPRPRSTPRPCSLHHSITP